MTAQGALPCRLALRQTFTQEGEGPSEAPETARFLGRGELTLANGQVRIACVFHGELAPQTIVFPLDDPAAVTLESPGGRLCFPGKAAKDGSRAVPLSLSTPAGTLEFLFTPLLAENGIDPAAARGSVTLRYRLAGGGGFLRTAELRYTLF